MYPYKLLYTLIYLYSELDYAEGVEKQADMGLRSDSLTVYFLSYYKFLTLTN